MKSREKRSFVDKEGCSVCGFQGCSSLFKVGDTMYGSNVEYLVLECASCNTLRLINTDRSSENNYPIDYAPHKRRDAVKGLLAQAVSRFQVNSRGPMQGLLRRLPGSDLAIEAMNRFAVKRSDSILEVGCGSGAFAQTLSQLGYKQVTAIDPFLKEENVSYSEPCIRKASIYELEDRYDVIIMNHVFEHIEEPRAFISKAKGLLKDKGKLIILVPLADSLAWKIGGRYWIQLDPPRHKFIYTSKSLTRLLESEGLYVKRDFRNSGSFQIIGTVGAVAGRPLLGKRSVYGGSVMRRFSLLVMRIAIIPIVVMLNITRTGDQGAFLVTAEP